MTHCLPREDVVQLARAIADGKVKMTLGDLDKLIRLEAFLRDEPDSRQEVVFADLKNKTAEEPREMVSREVKMLKELSANESEGIEREKEGRSES